MQLTDTALVLLSAAAQREDYGVELPAKLKGAAAAKVLGALRKACLIEEVRARGSLPVWRRGEDNRPLALRITKAGLKAIRVEDEQHGAVSATPTHGARKPASSKRKAVSQASSSMPSKAVSQPNAIASGRSPASSKQAQVIDMLRRPEGVTVSAIMQATGWQQHSVRGFFAGPVRKRLGLTLVSEVIEGMRVYRILRDDSDGAAHVERTRKAA